jgi:phosphonate transport system permease protein
VTRTRIDVFRYFPGWELFWFSLESPYYGKSLGELIGLAFSDKRIDAAKSNFQGMAESFWHNRIWQHGEVAWALFETVLMAFIGTFGAALIALPLAFLSAQNFTPSRVARFGLRRVFDFLRGVDGLIWTIVLSRAFGPGPMTGALAILLTDTGSFGKMFSEALENTDKKQIEGIRSTGANAVQRYRFGVIPR